MKKIICIILILLLLNNFPINTYALAPPGFMSVYIRNDNIDSDNAVIEGTYRNGLNKIVIRFEIKLYQYNQQDERVLIASLYKNEFSKLNEYTFSFDFYNDFGIRLKPNTKYYCSVQAIHEFLSSEHYFVGNMSFTTLDSNDNTIDNDIENDILSNEEWEYKIIDDEAYLIRYKKSDNNVIVPSHIDGYPVKAIEDYALASKSIFTIEVSEGIEYIGKYAFAHCDSLESVILPSTIKHIDYSDDIGYSCFYKCSMLKNIQVNENNNYFSSLDGVLYNKDKTKLLVYPRNKYLYEFEIPEGVKFIDEYAFANAHFLESITIPESVEYINPKSFFTSYKLANIYVAKGNNMYSSVDGVLYSYDKTKIILYPYARTDTNYFILDSVNTIEDYAFINCNKLENITLPENIINIGDFAFFACGINGDIQIPSTVTYIGSKAFAYCSGLRSVKFLGVRPNNITEDTFLGTSDDFYLMYDLAYEDSWQDFTIYSTDTFGTRIEQPTPNNDINIRKSKILSIKKINKKSVVLKIKKIENAKKYLVQYSTNKKFKNKITKTIKNRKITIKKLKKGKIYYFRVRGINRDIKGKWSNVKKVKIRK